jgi:hypothetical protein
MPRNHTFNVGVKATDQKDYDNKVNVLSEALMEYDFVTDVLDFEEPHDNQECEHKWRDYSEYGGDYVKTPVVCKYCGTPAPDDVTKAVKNG